MVSAGGETPFHAENVAASTHRHPPYHPSTVAKIVRGWIRAQRSTLCSRGSASGLGETKSLRRAMHNTHSKGNVYTEEHPHRDTVAVRGLELRQHYKDRRRNRQARQQARALHRVDRRLQRLP